jgi:hypothetical protein
MPQQPLHDFVVQHFSMLVIGTNKLRGGVKYNTLCANILDQHCVRTATAETSTEFNIAALNSS